MKGIVSTLVFSFIVLFSFGQKDHRSFIPAGYDTLYEGVARGDLNKDGIEDIAMVLGGKWENQENWMEKEAEDSTLPKRKLLILFGGKDGYKKAGTGDKVILCKECGGVFGDPFAGIEIKNGLLTIYHYGGSSWRWSYTHKFRYQQNDFYLIGKTYESYLCVEECEKLNSFAGTHFKDENLVTGAYEEKKISDEGCKVLVDKKGKQDVKPLISLSKFEIDN